MSENSIWLDHQHDSCRHCHDDLCRHCGDPLCLSSSDVFEAEHILAYEVAGRALAKALREARVSRHAVVTWQTDGANGEISLEEFQAGGLEGMLLEIQS